MQNKHNFRNMRTKQYDNGDTRILIGVSVSVTAFWSQCFFSIQWNLVRLKVKTDTWSYFIILYVFSGTLAVALGFAQFGVPTICVNFYIYCGLNLPPKAI